MTWTVELHEDFEKEFRTFPEEVQDELLAKAILLEKFGPQLSRPHVDTLKGSKYANMKELRFEVKNEVWRVAFAFDPKRSAILLTGGDKQGTKKTQFYKRLIKVADERFDQHLMQLIKDKENGNSGSKNSVRASKKAAGKNKGKGR